MIADWLLAAKVRARNDDLLWLCRPGVEGYGSRARAGSFDALVFSGALAAGFRAGSGGHR